MDVPGFKFVFLRRGTMVLGQCQWNVKDFFAIAESTWDDRLDTLLCDKEEGFFLCLKAAVARRERHELQKRPSLLDVLRDARDHDADDPKDKVFAVLGLCHQNVISHDIEPDYKDSIDIGYTTVARNLLQRSVKPSSVLLTINSSRSRFDIPS